MELTVIAKPYAKALSEIATADNSYNSWQEVLEALALIVSDEQTKKFVNAPQLTAANKCEFLISSVATAIGRELSSKEKNFIELLITNNKVLAATAMSELFNALDTSGTKHINVISAYELSADEKDNLAKTLSNKYGCNVSLDTVIDNNLSAGVVIKDGDKVVDLSISARVDGLAARLSM